MARALYLAGRALGDRELSEAGVEAMRSVFRRAHGRAAMPDPTFCHGRAGVLLVTVRMAEDTGRPEPWQGADRLAADLAGGFGPATAFGCRYPLSSHGKGPELDEPGLLQGAGGVAPTLLSYADARGGARPGSGTRDTALRLA
ncbi:hypothetical protein SUDANB180_06565 [Streptomyces sp. enrichment culture]